MKRARLLFVLCLMVFTLVLAACNKNGELDLKTGILETGTPTPDETETTPEPTATAEPTKEVTPTAEPTTEPTAEPTAEPTEEPTPTEPEVTEEPTPTEAENKYADEDIDYEKPELLTMGAWADGKSRYTEDGTYNKLYEVSYDMLMLGDEDKEKYPNLALGIDVSNLEFKDYMQNAIDRFEGFVSDGNGLDDHYYFSRVKYDILRADSYVVSVKESDSIYEGGVHPDSGIVGYSIDSETGDRLTVQDVCNDPDSLGTMIAYKLEEKYGLWEEDGKIEELTSYVDGKIADGSQYFAVGYEGVTFFYTPYEIGTYADGSMSVTLSFEESFVGETENGPELIGLFKKKYRTVPDNYMITMSLGEAVELLDIDEEKSGFSTFTVCEIPNAEYEFALDGIYFMVNDKETLRMDRQIDKSDVEINLIKMGDDRFIMLRTLQDSDDTYTYLLKLYDNGEVGCNPERDIYDASGYTVAPLKCVYGDGDWDYSYTDKTVYDPMNLKVNFRYDVIGTNFVNASVHIDPEKEEFVYTGRFFEFTYRWPLTLKKNFKAGMIDPELAFNENEDVTGETDAEVELVAGEVIYLEKCTSDKQVFFSTDNGEWGTFVMDKPADPLDEFGIYFYSSTIAGEDIDDLFEGISYAD